MNYDSEKFYDIESTSYSEKRYEGTLCTYSQFIFRKRLQIFLNLLGYAVQKRKFSLLDIGCADGVILSKILTSYSSCVEKMTGIDISPMMIKKAQSKYLDPRLSFVLRDGEGLDTYNIVIELGVHVENLEEEIRYVKSHLSIGGFFVYSAAGRNSSHAWFKLRNAPYIKDYRTYQEVEAILLNHFEIIEAELYGLFIPKIWKVPAIARFLQPFFDTVFRHIIPSFFHEKIYLLRDKRTP